MKILSNFDRAVADILQDKVKARLSFKVRDKEQVQTCALGSLACRKNARMVCELSRRQLRTNGTRLTWQLRCARLLGLLGYLPLLRRGVDLPYQERFFQDGERRCPSCCGQDQDRQLQREASGVGHRGLGSMQSFLAFWGLGHMAFVKAFHGRATTDLSRFGLHRWGSLIFAKRGKTDSSRVTR